MGSVLKLSRDYNGAYGSRIQFNKDLTIDGQGHTLDCLNTECSAFYSSSGNIVLKNLIIKNGHNDDNYNGGAIHIEGSAQYTIEDCIFENNWADDRGGAIYNGADKPLSIINSQFNNNEADDIDGGAIYSVGDLNIIGSTFTSNKAVFGGAIYCEKCVEIKNSTFRYNKAKKSGGAIYARIININNNLETAPFNTFFTENKVDLYGGGALYATEYINAVNTIFYKNTATNCGGAAYARSNVNVRHCIFEFNKVTEDEAFASSGGAICAGNTAIINNVTFKSNYADNKGGAVYANDVTMTNDSSFFEDNAAFDHGGAIYTYKFNENVCRASFINNEAYTGDGGAIYIYKENHVIFSNCYFEGNKCDDEGGAIYSEENINVRFCLFEYNQACEGGAIGAVNTAIIDNCTFKNNYADAKGGAVYAKDVTMTNAPSFFEGNTAKDYGGAIYTDKFNDNVCRASFINNDAYTKDGGAIYINKENHVIFSNCYFERNKCDDRGGVIYFDSCNSGVYLRYNIFIDNYAGDKGEIVYTCGKFNEIKNNWYGINNPDFTNKLTEWHSYGGDEDHSDVDPVITKLSLSDNPAVEQTSTLTVYFLSSNSNKLDSNLYGIDAKFNADNGATITNYKIGKNNVTSDITFNNGGITTITATVNKQVLKLSYNLPSKCYNEYCCT